MTTRTKLFGNKKEKKISEMYDYSDDKIKKIHEFLITEGKIKGRKEKLLVYYVLDNPKLSKRLGKDLINNSYIYSGTKQTIKENLKKF